MGTSNRYTYQGSYGVPKSKHTAAIRVGGVCLCILSAAISFMGTRAVVDALSTNSDNAVDLVRQQYAVESQVEDTDTSVLDNEDLTSVAAQAIITYDFTTDQLTWAHEHHIRWNSDGNPVNEYGVIEDDPTTEVNELLRAVANGTADEKGRPIEGGSKDADTKASEKEDVDAEAETEPEVNPYEGMEGVSQLSDGTYVYTVKSGDTLSKIADMFGTTADELVKLNDIPDKNVISVGQQIKLPSGDITVDAHGAGLG